MTDTDRAELSLAFAELTMVLEEAGTLASAGQSPDLPERCYADLAAKLRTLIGTAAQKAEDLGALISDADQT